MWRLALVLICLPCGLQAQSYSLRFFGNGVNDIDRVKIEIDDPATNVAGPPVDVGADDFTIEFWMKGEAADNTSSGVTCGFNNNWILGNIIIDRDRFNQGRNYGISIAGGSVVFGTMAADQSSRTICSSSSVLDNAWHHIAVQRRRSDGWMWLYIDGALEADADGPDGDISYPDDGVPGNYCGGPCTNSDPFIVIAAEKHDAGSSYPSFNGFVDEVRFSDTLRYTGAFDPPYPPIGNDARTVGLYRFEAGAGTIAFDYSGSGSPDGAINIGGSPQGPVWTTDVPGVVLALDQDTTATTFTSRIADCAIFPNPASEIIRLRRCPEVEKLFLVSMSGTMWPVPLHGEAVSLKRVPAGVYVLGFLSSAGTASRRLVILPD